MKVLFCEKATFSSCNHFFSCCLSRRVTAVTVKSTKLLVYTRAHARAYEAEPIPFPNFCFTHCRTILGFHASPSRPHIDSPLLSRISPMFSRISLTFSRKSPMFSRKTPTFSRKPPLYSRSHPCFLEDFPQIREKIYVFC